MITVKDMFDYAVESNLSLLAHSIQWANMQGLVDRSDDSEKLKEISFDNEAIVKMKEENALQVGTIKLFAAKTRQDSTYAFYFAECSLDVHRLHEDLFREQRLHVTEADRLMPNRMAFADTGEEVSMYEYRERVAAFPAYIGHAAARENMLYRMK